MPANVPLEVAAKWLAIAARDLRIARAIASSEPAGSVFHSQQAAEKAAKAFLAAHDVPFRKTHDLEELSAVVAPLNPPFTVALKDCEDLSRYAVIFRYLDAPHEPDEAEALDALSRAQRLYDEVTTALTPPTPD